MSAQPAPPVEPSEPPSGGGAGASLRTALILLVVLVVAGGVAILVLGGKNTNSRPTVDGQQSVASSKFSGSLLQPAQTEPTLSLHNYKGESVNIGQYRGKAVLVTFLYTKCPDVCPIIASNLGVALNRLGKAKASKVQVVAVSVDPRGDTPKAVSVFLERHRMTGRMQYLIGSAKELGGVWKAWGVGSEQDAQQPQLVNHTGLVYGISASGKMTTVYAANFKPQEIAHDVPLLAAS